MKVLTHIANSPCVVYLYDWYDSPYIEAQRDVRYPEFNWIELVISGHVKHRELVPIKECPEYIIALIKQKIYYEHSGLDIRISALENTCDEKRPKQLLFNPPTAILPKTNIEEDK